MRKYRIINMMLFKRFLDLWKRMLLKFCITKLFTWLISLDVNVLRPSRINKFHIALFAFDIFMLLANWWFIRL